MMDATQISTLMDDARECEQPDAMKEKATSTQEQPRSSPKNKVNGTADTITITTTAVTAAATTPSVGETKAPSSTASVAISEDRSSKRPEEEKEQQQASRAAAAAATKEAVEAADTATNEAVEAAAAAVNVNHHHHALVLTQLARQLEYYFSCRNLAKDTYVQTLRKLNSGCVPVAILANFSKVKLLLSSSSEEERVHAVVQASTEHSEGRLRVVSIDTGSGKIVMDDTRPPAANTILAIGTHDNEPLTIATDAVATTSPTAVAPSSPLGGGATNTLILRDVIPQVTEQDIQTLFTFEGCPSVESIRQDVGNCWFVRFDTDDRVVMAQTMMHVQTLTLAGYPVHARLKASLTSTVCVDTVPPMPTTGWVPDANSEGLAMIAAKSTSSRKKKSRGRKNKKKSNTNTTENSEKKDANDNKNIDSNNTKIVSTATTSSKSPSVIPPSLDEDNFPTLHDKKVDWETISEQGTSSSKGDNPDDDKDREDDDDEEEDEEDDGDEEEGVNEGEEEQRRSSSSFSKATFSSDGASTTTTTSSSTESFPKKTLLFPAVGGYAAALMTTPCPKRQQSGATTATPATDKSKPQEMRSTTAAKGGGGGGGGTGSVDDEIAAATAAGGPPPMVVQPPTWSQGRSFADILRKD